MTETRSCATCGGATTAGQVGTLQEPQLYFADARVSEFGGMRMVRASGGRVAINAVRCLSCGHIELFAQS